MKEIKRDVGLEILEGLRELRSGECSVPDSSCRRTPHIDSGNPRRGMR